MERRPMRADPSVVRDQIDRGEPGVVLTMYVCDCGIHRDRWVYRCSTCGAEPRYVSYAAWPFAGRAALAAQEPGQ